MVDFPLFSAQLRLFNIMEKAMDNFDSSGSGCLPIGPNKVPSGGIGSISHNDGDLGGMVLLLLWWHIFIHCHGGNELPMHACGP